MTTPSHIFIGTIILWELPNAPEQAKAKRVKAPKRKKVSSGKRKIQDKETQRWHDAMTATREVMKTHAPNTKRWFVIDREGDSWSMLHAASQDGDWMTIRSNVDRKLVPTDDKQRAALYLRQALSEQPLLDEFQLLVPGNHKRTKRTACMQLRACRVTLDMHESWSKKKHPLTINALWVREVRTTPDGEEPLDWVLLTNHSIDTLEDAHLVIYGYTQRWRIEDFHKTWKSAGTCVEENLLRSTSHVIKWAMILASVAVRIERLKLLSRTSPDLPASVELDSYEIRALVLLKKKYKKRNEVIPHRMPTIAEATFWIAQLGGYTRRSNGSPPGSISIARGLEYLQGVAEGLRIAEAAGPPRKLQLPENDNEVPK